jgi:hypothetical protein
MKDRLTAIDLRVPEKLCAEERKLFERLRVVGSHSD